MKLTRFDNIDTFISLARDLLLEHEAQNNLMFGIASGILRRSMPENCYLAVVERRGKVVAVAIEVTSQKYSHGCFHTSQRELDRSGT